MKSNTDFEEWLRKGHPDEQAKMDYINKRYILDIDLSFDNFENFITGRKKLMTDQFKSLLGIDTA